MQHPSWTAAAQQTHTANPDNAPLPDAPKPSELLLAAAAKAGATSAAAAAAAVAGVRLLSDVPDVSMFAVGRPPRVVDAGLRADMKQVC